MRVDLDAAIFAARALTPETVEAVPLTLEDFSQTVRSIRRELGGTTLVTAARIAERIQARHSEYGGGFGGVTLRPSDGPTAPTDDWLSRVRGLYGMDSVRPTRHRAAGTARAKGSRTRRSSVACSPTAAVRYVTPRPTLRHRSGSPSRHEFWRRLRRRRAC